MSDVEGDEPMAAAAGKIIYFFVKSFSRPANFVKLFHENQTQTSIEIDIFMFF